MTTRKGKPRFFVKLTLLYTSGDVREVAGGRDGHASKYRAQASALEGAAKHIREKKLRGVIAQVTRDDANGTAVTEWMQALTL